MIEPLPSDSSLDERFQAIPRLQTIRGRHRCGSERHERADHAITLALNRGRAGGEHLLRNLMRDSRRIRDRRRDWLRDIEVMNIDAIDAAAAEEERPPAEHETDLFNYYARATMTPEAVLLEKEFCAELEHRVRALGALPTLEGLVDGLTTKELAATTGVSVSTVKRSVAKIRTAATKLRSEP
jgi:DNA-directed RNA polymerase specialized sigma24 family protein